MNRALVCNVFKTPNYKGTRRDKKGHKETQRETKGHKGTQRDTKGHKGTQRDTKGHKGAQRNAHRQKRNAHRRNITCKGGMHTDGTLHVKGCKQG